MRRLFILLYKAIKKIWYNIFNKLSWIISFFKFYFNNVEFSDFKTSGVPFLQLSRSARLIIGPGFSMNNTLFSNPIGRPQRCVFALDHQAELIIGANVGMSFTAINCQKRIVIGNNVLIGGGTCIYDSDYHQIDPINRRLNKGRINKKEVIIEDNVFIGAHSLILKGVVIGENSVIGAGSVVAKSIPSNEIWAGNPARFVSKILINDSIQV